MQTEEEGEIRGDGASGRWAGDGEQQTEAEAPAGKQATVAGRQTLSLSTSRVEVWDKIRVRS